VHVLHSVRPKAPFDLNTGWDQHRRAASDALAGQRVELKTEDAAYQYDFGATTVSWTAEDGGPAEAQVNVVESRPGIYFVDWIEPTGTSSVSLVIDRDGGRAIRLTNTVLTLGDGYDLRQTIEPALLAGAPDGASPPARSADMVGLRLLAEYQDGHILEQIYTNSGNFVWQSIQGRSGPGHGACELSTVWKIADELYLVTWVEQRPVGAVLLTDLAALRNNGKLFGVDDSGIVSHLAGARLTNLGRTSYPAGAEPI
jgi:phenolic acid decarboxylase